MKFKFGLLPRVVLAIALGVACGFFLPGWATRIALTFNAIFGQFLGFAIPLLILGLVAPGIADLGRNAGRLLALTAALAYAFTLFSGFGTYLTGRLVFPVLLEGSAAVLPEEGAALAPYFTVEMPPVMGVMSALVLAFVLGLGMAYIRSETLKGAMDDFKRIIELVILRVIIPLLVAVLLCSKRVALLHFRHIPLDGPVGAGGRGVGRLRETDRGDLLHDGRAAPRAILRRGACGA